MLVELTEAQTDLIAKIAVENGFRNHKITTSPGSVKGDNFLGILTTVTIEDDKNKLDLILKSAHTNENFRKLAPLREAYLREIYLYENIFHEFKTYQEDHSILDPFDNFTKIYGATTLEKNECFVMENLKTKGYQLWDKKVPMNSGHLTAVFKQYAKFHATCLAMKHKNPELYEKLTQSISANIFEKEDDKDNEEKMKAYIKTAMNNGYQTVEDDPILTEFLKLMEQKIQVIFFKDLKDPEYKEVLIHGDCWCNNFMFKYEDDQDKTRPSNLKIIDWQISSVSSPAYDFAYFFVVNSSKESLDNYDSFLKLYYNTLSEHLRNFDCDPDQVFPFSRLEKHLNLFMIFGLFTSLTVLKIMLCDSDEAPDFSQLSNEDNFLEEMDFKFKNFDLFKKRVREIIAFVNDRNFISA